VDPTTQLLQVAQDLIQTLCNLLSLPAMPPRAQVQRALDLATAKIKIIHDQAANPPVPLVPPQFVPPTAQAAPDKTPLTPNLVVQ
jgi:hypothetical protein